MTTTKWSNQPEETSLGLPDNRESQRLGVAWADIGYFDSHGVSIGKAILTGLHERFDFLDLG